LHKKTNKLKGKTVYYFPYKGGFLNALILEQKGNKVKLTLGHTDSSGKFFPYGDIVRDVPIKKLSFSPTKQKSMTFQKRNKQ